nr:MAG TPA: hypothetical protein [Bacteriophage sp.]
MSRSSRTVNVFTCRSMASFSFSLSCSMLTSDSVSPCSVVSWCPPAL